MSDFYNDVYNQEGKEIFLDSININKYPFRWWERLFEKTIELEEKIRKIYIILQLLRYWNFISF